MTQLFKDILGLLRGKQTMRWKAELKDERSSRHWVGREDGKRLDPVGTSGGERNGQILDWYHFSSSSFFPKEFRIGKRENIAPWSLGRRKPRTAASHQGTHNFAGSREGATVQAPPPGSAPRFAPQGPAVWPGHQVVKGMRVGHEPSGTLQRLWETLEKLCRSLHPPPPLGHVCMCGAPAAYSSLEEEAGPHFTARKTGWLSSHRVHTAPREAVMELGFQPLFIKTAIIKMTAGNIYGALTCSQHLARTISFSQHPREGCVSPISQTRRSQEFGAPFRSPAPRPLQAWGTGI